MDPQTPPDAPAIKGQPLAFWRMQIDRAIAERKRHEPWWEANLKAYAPGADQTPEGHGSHVNTNRDFTLVERKKADLFYQTPEVTLSPSPLLETPRPKIDPMTGQPAVDPQTGQPQMEDDLAALGAHEQILNQLLDADEQDALLMVHQSLFDVLCTAGIGATVMGYESVTVPVEQEVSPAVTDPMTGMELAPAQTAMVPVPMHERVFWHHISPKQLVIPADFTSTEWDRAPFLGFTFCLPLTATVRKRFKLPDDFSGSKTKADDQTFDHGAGADATGGVKTVTGVELWYKSSLFREDILHPDHLTHLVLIDGLETPAIEEDCPYQTIDDRGQLTPDSFVGHPVHPLTVRVLTDSAYPPSDCTLIRPLVNELNTFRRQMVEYRDALVMRWSYNTDVLPPDALRKITRSPIGGMIGLPSEAFVGEGAIRELPHGSMPRESFTSNDYIDNDIARTTAIDASGAGVQSTGSTTATEQQIIQANANARLDFERGRVLQWYIRGVTKFSTLVSRFLPIEQAAAIVGVDLAAQWDSWRKRQPASVAFTAMPDSALRVDQAVDRKQAQEFYTYVANDPFVRDRGKLLSRLFRKFHLDPTGVVGPPEPASPQPTPASLSFKGEDLIGPQAPIVVELLMQSGWKISPEAIQQSQGLLLQQQQLEAAQAAEAEAQKASDKHGGKVSPMETLDKHAADAGMGMQGVGGITPQGGAPQIQ